MKSLALMATTAFGLEAVVSRELEALGYAERTVSDGRVEFTGDVEAICRELHGNPDAMPLILATTYDVDTCKPMGRIAQADELVSVPVVAEEVLARLDILTSQAGERDLRLPRFGEHIEQYTIAGTIAWAAGSYVFKVHSDVGDEIQVMKMLSQGASRDESLVRRFDRELQMMDDFRGNDRIVQVLARGEFAGHAYCVMEYVDGSPITTYCQRERISLAERLRLFQQVCRGVQHAHSKAVVHRDLKPSNIMVTREDGKPVPKIRWRRNRCW